MSGKLINLWLALAFLSSLPTYGAEFCPSTTNILPTSALRGFSAAPDCFEIQPITSGNLWVEAQVPGWSEGEPRLELKDCARGESHLEIQRQLPDSLWLEVQGLERLVVCLSAQDPAQDLGEYLLQSVFVPSSPFKGDPEEDEPDPHPLTVQPSDEPCHRLRQDDHADTRRCAEALRLGEVVEGRFDQGGRWDGDVFVFAIREMQTLQFETSGDSDTFGTLTDADGFRLAWSDGGGKGDNFHFIKTLVPGRYFLRVDGRAGEYRCTVEALPEAP
jgi:hypothetical protein